MKDIQELLQSSDHHVVTIKHGAASFQPIGASHEQVEAFQPVARWLVANEGCGYTVDMTHRTSEFGHGLVDIVMATVTA